MARLDVVDVDCTRNARDGVQLADIVLQVVHLMDEVAVALEIHLSQQPGLGSCLQSSLTVYRKFLPLQLSRMQQNGRSAARLLMLVLH